MSLIDGFVTLIQERMLVADRVSSRMAAANIARELEGMLVHGEHYRAAARGSGGFG
jgi:uncharacterized membrane-anchored protein YjiN (DUF445 family)